MNWQGYNNSITGNLSFVEEEKRGNINITLPKRDGSCIGSYILSSSQGTWSIICDKINKSASGFLKWNTKDKMYFNGEKLIERQSVPNISNNSPLVNLYNIEFIVSDRILDLEIYKIYKIPYQNSHHSTCQNN